MSTLGWDSKTLSTFSFGATSTWDAALRGYDAALVLNIANGYFLPLLLRRNIPIAVNTDGIEWERGKWGRLARGVFRGGAALTARYADVLIADSEAVGLVWRRRFGRETTFIPYGAAVLTGIAADKVEALGLKRGAYALAVARLIPENNVDLFLDAVALAKPAAPAVVVGSAVSRSPTEERLRRLSEDGKVIWLGHVADQDLLAQLWAHCGVYVHGHSVGGTNPALLQALGAGAPTLALDTAYNREVLGAERQLFPAQAPLLALRIRALLDDRNEQGQLGRQGQAIVAARYRWDAVCREYLEALHTARDLRHLPDLR